VWIVPQAEAPADRLPHRFLRATDPDYTTVRDIFEVEGTVHAVAENALDVPHTAFLHKGLFRTGAGNTELEVHIRRWHDRVEAEYIGEPRPPGLVGRLLAPGGGVVVHFDRFILPCITEVEYSLGERSHVVVSSALTPVSETRTRLFASVSFRFPMPGAVVAAFLKPLARKIFAQDAVILRAQSANILAHGGEQFVSTELDTLGMGIRRLLSNAERGDRSPMLEPEVKNFRMRT
jgi:phenylpropionate dioxygenase-like ring-hydroxylating dioxygenase large terminal subunit